MADTRSVHSVQIVRHKYQLSSETKKYMGLWKTFMNSMCSCTLYGLLCVYEYVNMYQNLIWMCKSIWHKSMTVSECVHIHCQCTLYVICVNVYDMSSWLYLNVFIYIANVHCNMCMYMYIRSSLWNIHYYTDMHVYIKSSLGKDLLGLLQPWYNFAKGDDQIVSGKISAAISYILTS